jgi:hypothetical protein
MYLFVGLAAGYVIGAARGRDQYVKIKKAATDFVDTPRVQNVIKKADDLISEKAPALHDVGGAVVDAATSKSPSGSSNEPDSAASDSSAAPDSSSESGFNPDSSDDSPPNSAGAASGTV